MAATTISFKFSTCPSYSGCRGKNLLGDESFAYMQYHGRGRMATLTNLSKMAGSFLPPNVTLPADFSGTNTLEVSPKDPGNQWKRRIQWGAGSCAMLQMGSYDLIRLVDGNGNAVGSNLD